MHCPCNQSFTMGSVTEIFWSHIIYALYYLASRFCLRPKLWQSLLLLRISVWIVHYVFLSCSYINYVCELHYFSLNLFMDSECYHDLKGMRTKRSNCFYEIFLLCELLQRHRQARLSSMPINNTIHRVLSASGVPSH